MSLCMSCFCLKKAKPKTEQEQFIILASETSFTVNEIEALLDLFKKLRSPTIDDGFIHKEEFQLALLRNSSKQNLFADRVFDMFDIKHNGVIEFGEFVRSLSIFHPNASKEKKIEFAFRLFDLRQAGYIEHNELKKMVLATLTESDVTVPDDAVESIVEKTMREADSNGDGKIDEQEWKEYVAKNPSVLKIMTLPYLKCTIKRINFFFASAENGGWLRNGIRFPNELGIRFPAELGMAHDQRNLRAVLNWNFSSLRTICNDPTKNKF